MLAAHGVNGDKATERARTILGAFSDAPPFPDVGEALERLHGAGIKVKVGQQCDEVSFHVTISGAYLGCRIFTLALSIGSRVAKIIERESCRGQSEELVMQGDQDAICLSAGDVHDEWLGGDRYGGTSEGGGRLACRCGHGRGAVPSLEARGDFISVRGLEPGLQTAASRGVRFSTWCFHGSQHLPVCSFQKAGCDIGPQ